MTILLLSEVIPYCYMYHINPIKPLSMMSHVSPFDFENIILKNNNYLVTLIFIE